MIKYEDECCNCAVPAYPCLGSACPRRNVKHYYCDECNDDVEDLYNVNGRQLCEECMKDELMIEE